MINQENQKRECTSSSGEEFYSECNCQKSADENVFKDEALKVVDIHKMYSDRATAIRALMVPLIAIAFAALSALIGLKEYNFVPIFWAIAAIDLFVAILAIILKIQTTKLVESYEGRLGIDVIRKNRLLPIDALFGPVEQTSAAPEARWITYSNLLATTAALLATGGLLWSLTLLST